MALTTCRECNGQVANDAPVCPHCGTKRPAKRPASAKTVFITVGALLVFGMCVSAIGGKNETPSSASTTPGVAVSGNSTVPAAATTKPEPTAKEKAVAEKRFNECKKKLIAAQKLGVLYDMDWQPPREPRIVVGPTFVEMPIDAKEGFVETVNCFLMAGTTDHINFDALHWQTGRAIGRYSWGSFEMK